MSFLSGSPRHQPGNTRVSSGFGKPSNVHQKQQQQQQTHLSGSSIPAVLASSPLSPASPASDLHSDWHCQGQMAPGGHVAAAAAQGGGRITLMEDEKKLGRVRTEGTLSETVSQAPGSPSFKMPVLKIEYEGSRGGRPREDHHRVGGAGGSLGSSGQSPNSPLSSHSSPSSSVPSPSFSPGRTSLNSPTELKLTSDSNFGQNNLQQNQMSSKEGFYILGSQVSSQIEQHGKRNTPNTCGLDLRHTEEEINPETPSSSGGLLGSLKESSIPVQIQKQSIKPYLGNQGVTQPAGTALPAAEASPPPGVQMGRVEESGIETKTLSNTENGQKGSPQGRDLTGGDPVRCQPQDLDGVEDRGVGPCFSFSRETKTSQSSEQPQRTAVRRAMSDCSHLSVPMVMAGTYPTGMGGSPVMLPNISNFSLMGTVCLPSAPYPHMAVRRSFTVTDGTEAAATIASMMSAPLMSSPVMPSSPPPKRHHGSRDTNFLLAVPPPMGTAINSTQDSKLNRTVKPDNKEKQEKVDKINPFDTREKEEQQKQDNGLDKNQKSDKIGKEEDKVEKMNVEINKANEKAEKTDKPEKINKDDKKEEEKKTAEKKEEKGGKGAAKSPTGTASKTLPSPDTKSKPDVGSSKPNSAKSRPSTLSTNGEANSGKRPSPNTASANKKSPVPKATTPSAAKRPPKAIKTPENGTAEKRPPVPKVTPTPRSTANKDGSSVTAASKTAANKNNVTDSKTGEPKKPKTARRPASTTSPVNPSPSPNGESHRRRVITKPPVPKQTPMEKKPPGSRTPRTPRPINAPTPDLKNIRSKIGSIDNIKYQPGGGKVSSSQNSKASDPSTPAAKAKVQVVHKKLDFSHVTSRCGSKDNIKHVPGGGKVQILNRKVDLSKVTSKCGSKDNIKYKPGGGDVKIESNKLNKVKSKVGSMDNVGPGNEQTNGHKVEKTEEKTSSSPSGAPATGTESAKAAAPGGVAKENGVKGSTPTPFGGDGLREPLSSDKRIAETN